MPGIPESPSAGGGGSDIRTTDLTSQVNGVSTVFNIVPSFRTGTLVLFWNGQKLDQGLEYLEVGNNQVSVLLAPPLSGSAPTVALQAVYNPL